MSKRDEYIEKMKKQLDELNSYIDELEDKAQHLKDETLVKYEKQISGLKELSNTARESLQEFKAAGEERWEHIAAEGDKVHKAFIHSYNYFKSQLK
jgi:predicted  nucleic acid-binding Zn-ribbon protein